MPIELGPIARSTLFEDELSVFSLSLSAYTVLDHVSGTIREISFETWPPIEGDFDGSGDIDIGDVLALQRTIRQMSTILRHDLTQDGSVNADDLVAWVHDVKQTYFGDADLDGAFSSADLINVFQAGEYEDDLVANSTWSSGDWNSDGEFTTSDMVIAFQDGGYEQGPRSSVSSVPEPTTFLGFVIGGMLSLFARSRR